MVQAFMDQLSHPTVPSQPDHNHSVQFWSDSDSFLSGWADSISAAVRGGNAAVCLVSKIHNRALTRRFKQRGQDLTVAIQHGRYVTLDAGGAISAVMPEGRFDQARFSEFFGSAIAKASNALDRGARVTVFGEAVDLLWLRGKRDDVILWEQSWSALAKAKAFSLSCGYAIRAFHLPKFSDYFQTICSEHAMVTLPAGLPSAARTGPRAHKRPAVRQVFEHAERLVQGKASVRYPEWQDRYRVALLETDRNTLFKQVESAEAAVLVRLHALPEGDLDERKQLMAAWSGLQMIKERKLGFSAGEIRPNKLQT